jgi:hypothetical protein
MSDIVIQANDCIFAIDLGAGYVPVLCAKSFTVNVVTDEKEITTVGDGLYKDFDYKILSYTLNINGALKIQDGINPAVFDFLDFQKNFIEVPFRILFELGAQLKRFEGRAIVKTTNLLANSGQIAEGTVDLIGKGEFTLADALPSTVNLRLRMTGNDSLQALAKFRLIDTNGEIVFQSDTLQQASGGDLANPFDITVAVPKGSWYYFWQVDSETFGNTFDLDATPTKHSSFDDGIVNEQSFPTQLYDFNSDRNVTFTLGIDTPPPSCVPPSVSGTPALPDATTFVDYYYSISVIGTTPFNVSNVTKPTWMTIAVSGSIITFTGKPRGSDTGTGIPVTFDINNTCGTTNFNENMNVIANPSLVTLNYSFTAAGSLPVFRIYENGSSAITPLTASGSGSVGVNAGSTIEVQCTVAGHSKHLVITDDTASTTVVDTTTGSTTQAFSWVVTGGHIYTITETVS